MRKDGEFRGNTKIKINQRDSQYGCNAQTVKKKDSPGCIGPVGIPSPRTPLTREPCMRLLRRSQRRDIIRSSECRAETGGEIVKVEKECIERRKYGKPLTTYVKEDDSLYALK